jgi:IclR family transcriptional regulator, pca regulon regulatory protein
MFVRSLSRGLSVIRSFTPESPTQTLAQVASKTNMDRASARRMLHTLETLGYLRSEGRTFQLTPRVLDLGYRYLASLPLWSVAEPVLEELTKAVHESSTAAVLDGTDIVFVVEVPARKIMTVRHSVGMKLPAYCTSMGRVLLGGLSSAELDRTLRNSNIEKYTSNTVTSIPNLTRIIRQDREQGWSIVQHELEQGLSAIAVPVFDGANRIVAAVNLTGSMLGRPPAKMVSELLPHLRKTAETIQSLIVSTGTGRSQ